MRYRKFFLKMNFLVPLVFLGSILSCADAVMVCYFGSWSVYRWGNGLFDVENIDPTICTHAIFGFAGISSKTHEIQVLDPYNELCENWGKCAYDRFTDLKYKNANLKTILAVGGWNEGSLKYSEMARNSDSRRTFIDSVVKLLRAHDFDGLDMDWEYPNQRGGKPEDKENFILLLKELREEFDKHGYLLTAAVSAGKFTVDAAYDVPAMSQHLHQIHLMAYDFHGAWDPYTHHNSPLYAHPLDKGNVTFFNVDYAVSYWLELGAPKEKLVLGMSLYGRCWRLDDQAQTGFYAPAHSPGNPGPFTNTPGFWGYNEICEKQKTQKWTVVVDPAMHEPYGYYIPNGNLWCGYDDPTSLAIKAQYARDVGLAGCMVWSVDTDDFNALCHERAFHLVKTIHETYLDAELTAPPTRPITTRDPSATTEASHITPPPSGHCSAPGLNMDPSTCTVFWQCVEAGDSYIEYQEPCAPGTLFNPIIKECDTLANVCAEEDLCPNDCP